MKYLEREEELGQHRKTWQQCIDSVLENGNYQKTLSQNKILGERCSWREVLKAKGPSCKRFGIWPQSG